jgi:hypothetical protein
LGVKKSSAARPSVLDENRGQSYASAVRLLSTQLAPGAM